MREILVKDWVVLEHNEAVFVVFLFVATIFIVVSWVLYSLYKDGYLKRRV